MSPCLVAGWGRPVSGCVFQGRDSALECLCVHGKLTERSSDLCPAVSSGEACIWNRLGRVAGEQCDYVSRALMAPFPISSQCDFLPCFVGIKNHPDTKPHSLLQDGVSSGTGPQKAGIGNRAAS